jgi:hypothetical protein
VDEPGRSATWDVVAHPFRVVAIGFGWVVVPVGARSRRMLVRHDMLGRQFRTRTAALSALADAIAAERASAPARGRVAAAGARPPMTARRPPAR